MSPEPERFSYVASFPEPTDEQLATVARLLRPTLDRKRREAQAAAAAADRGGEAR